MQFDNILLLIFMFTCYIGVVISFEVAIFLAIWIFIGLKYLQLKKEKKI